MVEMDGWMVVLVVVGKKMLMIAQKKETKLFKAFTSWLAWLVGLFVCFFSVCCI